MNWELGIMKEGSKLKNLPEGWKKVRLGEVITYIQPTRFLVKTEKYDPASGIPVLTPGKTFILGYTDEACGIYTTLPAIIFDDFTTESRYINFPFKIKSSAIKILISKDSNNNLFYLYNLMQILNLKPGSEHKRFWISEFSKLKISLPPVPEQRKIAEILETVDDAIEKTDKIIEKYKRIKQGLMQELLTKGIVWNYESGIMNYELRDEKKHKFKDSPLGRIPEEWEVVRLGVCSIIMGQSPDSYQINKEEQGVAFLQGNAEFTKKYPKPVNWIEKPLKLAPKESILMSVRAPVGSLNIADKEYCIGRGLASINVNCKTFIRDFLWYVLHFSLPTLIKLGQGSTFEAIGSEELKNHILPLPPLPEQQKIAEILSQVDEVIEKETAYKEKLQRLKAGLMEDMLTGKVRVNFLIEDVKI